MTTLIISDLHLEADNSSIAGLFERFLSTQAKTAQALYILGDFFEVWIGDDDESSFNKKIIQQLKQATSRGLPIYFMHGNRDFLIGKRFIAASGCQLIPEEHVINLYGTPTLLMHGDTLCIEDKAYLKFRKRARSRLFQQLFLWKSLAKRKQIANNYRQKSQMHVKTLPDHIMDVTPQEVIRLMQKHNVQHLIHGHTHRPAIHSFKLNNKPASRIVLGAWHHHGSVLVCKENGEKELIEIT